MMYFKISRHSLSEIIWDQMFQNLANSVFGGSGLSSEEFPVFGFIDFESRLLPFLDDHRAAYRYLVEEDNSPDDQGKYLIVSQVPSYPVIHPSFARMDPWDNSMDQAVFNSRLAVPGSDSRAPGYTEFRENRISPPVIEGSIVLTLAKPSDVRAQRSRGPYSGPRKYIKITIRVAVVAQRTQVAGPEGGYAESLIPPMIALVPFAPGNSYGSSTFAKAKVSILSGRDLTESGSPSFLEFPMAFLGLSLNLSQLLNAGSLGSAQPGATLVNMGVGCSADTFYVGLDFVNTAFAARLSGQNAIDDTVARWNRFYENGLYPTEEVTYGTRIDRPIGEWGVSFSGPYFASMFKSDSEGQQIRGRWTGSGVMIDCYVTAEDACPLLPIDIDVELQYRLEIRFNAGDQRTLAIDLILTDADLDFWDSALCLSVLSFLAALAVIPTFGVLAAFLGATSFGGLFIASAGVAAAGLPFAAFVDSTELDDSLVSSDIATHRERIERELRRSNAILASAALTADSDGNLRMRIPLGSIVAEPATTLSPPLTSVGAIIWAGYDTTPPNRSSVEFRGSVNRPSLPRTVAGQTIFDNPLTFRSDVVVSIDDRCAVESVEMVFTLQIHNPTRFDIIILPPRLREGSPWTNVLRLSDIPEIPPPGSPNSAPPSPPGTNPRLIKIVGGRSAYFSFSTPLKRILRARDSLGSGEIRIVIRSNRGQFLYGTLEAARLFSASTFDIAANCEIERASLRRANQQGANTVPGSGGGGGGGSMGPLANVLDLHTLNLPGLSSWTEPLDAPESIFRLDPSIEPQFQHSLAPSTALAGNPGTHDDPILRAILGRNGQRS